MIASIVLTTLSLLLVAFATFLTIASASDPEGRGSDYFFPFAICGMGELLASVLSWTEWSNTGWIIFGIGGIALYILFSSASMSRGD